MEGKKFVIKAACFVIQGAGGVRRESFMEKIQQ